jgi:protein TonB
MSNVAKLPRLKTKSSKLMTSPAAPQEASTSEKNKEDLIPTDAPQAAPHSEIIETAKHNYLRQVTQAIYRKKHYPRQAWALNQEGSVLVKLRLNKKGKILGLEVLEKAPFKTLTEASLETIKSITKFPPIPDELGMEEITFRIPIEYKINI